MKECNSFAPIINKNSRVLILGSMPGVKSLEMQQYYAHPQNRFWQLMGMFCKEPNMANFNYEKKINILLDNKYALWDVVKFCNRNGSLDSNIRNEKPNEIPSILKKYKNIKIICLNGNKAYTAIKKHFPHIIEEYECYQMPSTSPTNAKYRINDLYNLWNAYLNNDINL